ncbi:mitochondrial 40s ribosomal mrp2 [Fusarium sporotrichioides]|uniref:Autophagy-related protein 29 n=1 Tax=Fusarium sporotrichioides TaxID=5514 RepID=A0A395RWZ7_FUSSP|nr:mitochondrial 40s ribosomal mrp2 [Fusarium sporotrichioides]
MAEPTYTVFVRVPIPRGDFVDPPPVNWDPVKDEALWKILSGAAKKQIDWDEIADRFEVSVDFLLQQVAWLTERHASQVRAQVRKATAAVRGSGPSPVPSGESAGPGHQRAHSALSFRRDSPMSRNEAGSGTGTPLHSSMRPLVTRNTSTNTTVLRDMTGAPASPRPGVGIASRTGDRRRLSSLPITSVPDKSPEQAAQPEPSPEERSPSPGPAEDSSPTSSDDESVPAQSRIIRRPPRFQQPDGGQYEDDDDDESEPAFQPYTSPSSKTSAQDLSSTLKGTGRGSGRRHHRGHGKPTIHKSNTSDSSASSAAMIQKPDKTDKSTEQRTPGPLSPRRTSELAGRSPGGKDKGYSREGSDGTPSMGSSYSDLDESLLSIFSHRPHSNIWPFYNSDLSAIQKPKSFFFASMFRRHWSGLPKDVSFPKDLAGLGYFVNDQDEVRSLKDPDHYFKFHINKNSRVNDRQRFQLQRAMEDIIHERLQKEGLQKFQLLPGNKKHCPIFFSPSIAKTERIVIIFGEPQQDLGFIAGRVVNGSGGLAKGSMISVVQALAKQSASPNDPEPPCVLLANMGQRYWWPDQQRALTVEDSADIPLPSLVHSGRQHSKELNEIPGSETTIAHMTTIFNKVLDVNKNANIDIIAIGQSCEVVLEFFENNENWAQWGHRLGGMLLVGTVFCTDSLVNAEFKDFLAKRARGYLISDDPLETPLAMPSGNPSLMIDPLGCPCLSSGESQYTEMILIKALEPALAYLQEIALTPGFANPDMAVAERLATDITDEQWSELPDEVRPEIHTIDSEWMKEEVKALRRWRHFEKHGVAPPEEDDDEDLI